MSLGRLLDCCWTGGSVGVTDGRGRGLYFDGIHLHEISRTVHTHSVHYPVSGLIIRPLDILLAKETFRRLFVEFRAGVRFRIC